MKDENNTSTVYFDQDQPYLCMSGADMPLYTPSLARNDLGRTSMGFKTSSRLKDMKNLIK